MRMLRPLFALFLRSLREDTRARFPTILRATLISVVLLILWSNERSFTDLAAPGRQFFTIVTMLNLGFIGVAALSIFPSAIAEEKEDETLALLRMTNLNPLAILFGKSTSRLTAALLLLAVQVPFTVLAITLGGVSMRQVWGAYAILGSTTFFLCNLALLASVYSRTTLRAGFLTGAFALILYILLPIGAMSAGVRPGMMGGPWGAAEETLSQQIWTLVIQANPAWALAMLLNFPGGMQRLPVEHLWINLAGGAVFFLVSWMIFDRFCAQTVDVAPRPKRRRREGQRHRWAWVTRTWSRLPVAWKDFHFMIGGRFGFYARLALAMAIFFTVSWMVFNATRGYYGPRWEEVSAIIMAIAAFCAGLEVLLQAGRIFGVERRRQTLSSLVTLPWSTGKIIRQKVLGFLPCLAPWLILAIGGLALSWEPLMQELSREIERASFNWEHDRDELAACVYAFLQGVLLLVMVVWFSLLLRRGALPAAIAVATVWNIIFAICVDAVPSRDEYLAIVVGILLTLPVLVIACRGVYVRIPGAAAEDS
jgi:ABC-type transport system involved in multi-copper enzyme maturation permease subunit